MYNTSFLHDDIKAESARIKFYNSGKNGSGGIIAFSTFFEALNCLLLLMSSRHTKVHSKTQIICNIGKRRGTQDPLKIIIFWGPFEFFLLFFLVLSAVAITQ